MQRALSVLVLVAIARLVFVGAFELAPDEAYYLTWALPAAPAHLDHPPMIAWLAKLAWALIHAGASIETATRFAPVLLAATTSALLLVAARALGATDRALGLLAVLSSFLPLPAAGGILFTPDGPLCVFFALAMLSLATSPTRLDLALLIVAATAAPLAKVSGYLVIPTILLARRAAKMAPLPLPVIALATLGALATLPFALASLRFQSLHAFTPSGPSQGLASPPPFPLAGVPIFALGQLALVLPAIFLFAKPTNTAQRAVAVAALVPMLPVLASAFVRVPEPNWTAPAYAGLLLSFALASDTLPADTSAFRIRVSLAVTAGVAVLLHTHLVRPVLPIPSEKDATARLHGWRHFACEGAPPPVTHLPPYALPSERDVYRTTCPRSPEHQL